MTERSHPLAFAGHAFVMAALAVSYAFAYGALVFSGPLGSGVGIGVESALVAAAIGGALVAWRSGFRFAIAGPDSNPSAVLALAGGGVALTAAPSSAVPTMLAIVACASVLTGVLMFALGRIRASTVIRYVPQPMIAGFNAVSGVFVILGAWHVIAGSQPQLLVSLVGGLLILAFARRYGGGALALGFLSMTVIGLAVPPVLHRSLDDPAIRAWFFSVPHDASAWLPSVALGGVDMGAFVRALPAVAIVAAVSAATLLFNASGLELLSAQEVDLDRELRLSGIANLAAALFGGMVSYVSYSRSSIGVRFGVRERTIGLTCAAIAALLVVIGPWRAIDGVPKCAIAALLASVGVGNVHHWLFSKRARLSLGDALTVWSIVIAVLALGFVPGILVGLAIGSVVFVVRYAKIDAVSHRSNASVRQSSLQRSRRETEQLASCGERARIYTLRGYIFFGTADRIYRELLEDAQAMPAGGFLVVDFADVTGMDSSAVGAFVKLSRALAKTGVEIVVSGMHAAVAQRWNAMLDADVRIVAYETLDAALESVERMLLDRFGVTPLRPASFEEWLESEFGKALAERLNRVLVRREFDTGNVLCIQGEPSDSMFFVEDGRVAVIVGSEHLERIRSVGPHSTLGEMGFYRGVPRSATVVAEQRTLVRELLRADFEQIVASDADHAFAFHAAVICTLADRIEQQNRTLVSLADYE